MGCAPSYPLARGPIVYELPYLYDTSGKYQKRLKAIFQVRNFHFICYFCFMSIQLFSLRLEIYFLHVPYNLRE